MIADPRSTTVVASATPRSCAVAWIATEARGSVAAAAASPAVARAGTATRAAAGDGAVDAAGGTGRVDSVARAPS